MCNTVSSSSLAATFYSQGTCYALDWRSLHVQTSCVAHPVSNQVCTGCYFRETKLPERDSGYLLPNSSECYLQTLLNASIITRKRLQHLNFNVTFQERSFEVRHPGCVSNKSKCNVYTTCRQTQLNTRWYANLLNLNRNNCNIKLYILSIAS